MISEYVLGGALIFMSVVLLVLVLMQTGKDKSLSGTIAGGSSSDTYYGKGKGLGREKLLARLTVVAAVIFAGLIVATFVVFARGEQWIVAAEAARDAANAAG